MKTFTKEEKREFSEARTKGLLDVIKQGIKGVATSDDWKAMLDMNSKLWRYSFNNQILISFQRPEASRVAGFQTWKQLGRNVKKGEKGIKILAPIFGKDRDAITEDQTKRLRGFVTVTVFDVAQTEGKELPKIMHWLTGSAPADQFSQLKKVTEKLGFSIEFKDLAENLGGYIDRDKRISISNSKDSLGQFHILLHELSHGLLGHPGNTTLSREEKELQAESAAWMVCRELGISSDQFSFGYFAVLTDGGKLEEAIEAAGRKAQGAAKQILEALEEAATPPQPEPESVDMLELEMATLCPNCDTRDCAVYYKGKRYCSVNCAREVEGWAGAAEVQS